MDFVFVYYSFNYINWFLFYNYRLTKYPLLFESLVKCTTNEEELLSIKRSFERSKIILNHVNQAVREAEDELRLSGIQKKLDSAPFEKVDHPLSVEYKVKNHNNGVLNLNLIYENYVQHIIISIF